MLVRHDVDRLGQASSASSESGSLELLLSLDALVGAATCGAQTDAAAQLERVARRNRRFHARMRTPHDVTRVRASRLRCHALQRRPSVAAPAHPETFISTP